MNGRTVSNTALRFLIALTVCLLALPAGAATHDWPMYGRTPDRVSRSAVRFESETLGVAWSTPPPQSLYAYVPGTPYFSSPSAAVVEGRPMVFIGSYDSGVYAYDARTGEQVWMQTTGDAVSATPLYAVIDGQPMLFVASSDRKLYALDPRPGRPSDASRILWSKEILIFRQTVNPARMANPLLADVEGKPTLFFGVWLNDQSGASNVQRGEILAVEPKDGSIRWQRTLGTGAVNTPCLGAVKGQAALFVPYEAGAIHALSVEDGRDLWDAPFAVGEEIHGGISYAEVDGRGTVFLGSRTAWAHAISADTGAKLWSYNAGLWVDSTPAFAVVDGRPLVFFGTYTFHIVACDARTGEQVWRHRTRGIVQGSPALAFMGDEPVVCVNALDSHVYIVSARDGRLIFRCHGGKFPWSHFMKGKTIWSSCIVADLGDGPLLIAPSYSGVVTAFAVNGEDANAGPPQDSVWDALGESYTLPAILIVAMVLLVTVPRLVRRVRAGAKPDAPACGTRPHE